MIKILAYKYTQNLKHKIIRIGQAYSIIQNRKPKQKDIEYIKNL